MKKTALLLSFVLATVLAMAQATDVILTQESSGGTYSMHVSDESYFLSRLRHLRRGIGYESVL